MPGIEKINSINSYNRVNLNQQNLNDKPAQNENLRKDRIANKIDNENFIYKDPRRVKSKSDVGIDLVKRPISIDDSNNIFYINHNGENEVVKVDSGEYNLTELSSEIQRKVNESFWNRGS